MRLGEAVPGLLKPFVQMRSMTFLFLCGVPGPVIKLLGNWKSDCYMKYIEFPLETRTAASELMKMRILDWECKMQ